MSALILALFLLLVPASAGGETLHAAIRIEPDAASLLPPEEGLRAGLARLFAAEYGRFAELAFDAERGQGGPPGIAEVRITLGGAGEMIRVTTDLTRGGPTRSLSSTVPRGSPASMLSTMAGDIAFLHFSSRDFSDLELSPPPRLTAMIQAGALQALTGWNAEDLEPISLTQSGDDVVLCFPHAYLTLGPRFRLTAATLRDLHAQAAGREQLQLSGIVAVGAGSASRLLLLSEREQRIAEVNPRLGTRSVREAPGLSGRGAQPVDDERGAIGCAVISRNGRALSVYSLSGGPPRSIPVPGSYVPAFCRDREGNLWTWDGIERRVRILTPDGREVHSIKPLFKASTMQLPQEMGVCDDGSFLLAGYGEVWKFENTGIPVWRLARLPGRPGERLPPSFSLAVNGTEGSFTILDAQSRRLLAFSPAPDDASLPELLARLDGRRADDVSSASGLALSLGLHLVAWQYGDLLAGSGGPETRRAEARIALLKEKAGLYAELAGSLANDLLYTRADGACLGAGEALRSLLAEVPGDPDATRLLQSVIGRRQEVRAALARRSDVRVERAEARTERASPAGAPVLAIRLRLRNASPETLTRIRVHLSIPGVTPMPSMAEVDDLAPEGESDAELVCAGIGNLPGDVPGACALVTYEGGGQSVSAAFSFPVSVAETAASEDPAAGAARRALPDDPLVRRLAGELLADAPTTGNGLPAVAGVLDALGSMRSAARAAPDAGGGPAPAGLRAALRGLSADETAWTLVTLSIAGSSGAQPGLVSCRGRLFTLVDAGIPLEAAVASHTAGLGRYEHLLSLLSRNGNLWLPLSSAVAPAGGSRATAWAAAEALRVLAVEEDQEVRVLWPLPQHAATAPVPVPFPFALPVAAAPVPTDSLLGQIESALEPR